jgi:hypothetical protein
VRLLAPAGRDVEQRSDCGMSSTAQCTTKFPFPILNNNCPEAVWPVGPLLQVFKLVGTGSFTAVKTVSWQRHIISASVLSVTILNGHTAGVIAYICQAVLLDGTSNGQDMPRATIPDSVQSVVTELTPMQLHL